MSTYARTPTVSWKEPVPLPADLPLSGNIDGDARIVLSTDTLYVWHSGDMSWIAIASPGEADGINGLTGDVSASGPGVVVATVNVVGGSLAAAVSTATVLANNATAANTASQIVKRDASGNFVASDVTVDNLFANEKIGIGTTSPSYSLSLDGDGGILAEGTFGSGTAVADSGAGSRMMWNPRKAAFRAGEVSGTQWDNAQVGTHSFASGQDNTASGDQSVAMGSSNLSTAASSIALGGSSQANGPISVAIGYGAISNGVVSVALGNSSTANGNYSLAGSGATSTGPISIAFGSSSNSIGTLSSALGYNITSDSWTQATFGQYNSPIGTEDPNSFVSTDPLFVIGNGINGMNRNNALMLLKNGNMGLDVDAPSAKLELPPSTTSAGSAPIKIQSGVLMTTEEDGAIESNGTHLYWTNDAGVRQQLDGGGGGGGATVALDNLASVAINADMPPDTDNAYLLGTDALRWGGVYSNESWASFNYLVPNTPSATDVGFIAGAYSGYDIYIESYGDQAKGIAILTDKEITVNAAVVPSAMTDSDLGSDSLNFDRVFAATLKYSVSNDVLGIYTGAHATDITSGVEIITGDAADSDSGGILLQTGTAASTRGSVTVDGNTVLLKAGGSNGLRVNADQTVDIFQNLNMNSKTITGVLDPTDPGQVSNKGYTDRNGWVDLYIDYTSFAVASTTHTVTLYSIPSNTYVAEVIVKHGTAFTGGSVSQVNATASIPLASTGTPFITQALDVFTAPSDINVSQQNYAYAIATYNTSGTVELLLESTGANLDALTQGDLEVFVHFSKFR